MERPGAGAQRMHGLVAEDASFTSSALAAVSAVQPHGAGAALRPRSAGPWRGNAGNTAASSSSLPATSLSVPGPTPVAMQGAKGIGYLYVKVLEVGKLDALDVGGSCCSCCCYGCCSCCCSSAASVPRSKRASPGCCSPGGCCSGGAKRQPQAVSISMRCDSLEVQETSTQMVQVGEDYRAVFHEEILVRSLNFCGADSLRFRIQGKGNQLLGEAVVPLRVAVPPPLAGMAAPAPEKNKGGVVRQNTCVKPQYVRSSDVAAKGEATIGSDVVIEASSWLKSQRILLRPTTTAAGGVVEDTGCGTGEGDASITDAPYLEVQLLQLVDSGLPRLLLPEGEPEGVSPLLVAVRNQQAQLVRAYLGLDVLEKLPASEQAACLEAAIHCGCNGAVGASILSQLLEHLKPAHGHLLAAIRLGSVDLVEALLQAGGASVLHPLLQGQQRGSASSPRTGGGNVGGGVRVAPARPPPPPSPPAAPRALGGAATGNVVVLGAGTARGREAGGAAVLSPLADWVAMPNRQATAPPSAGGIGRRQQESPAVGTSTSSSSSSSSSSSPPRKKQPALTPLALACSLGHVGVVEAMCLWAKRERVHIDPTAPLSLGGSAPASASSTSPWWDRERAAAVADEERGMLCLYGDPPLIMAVRGRASLQRKLRLVAMLVKDFGFATDVRSPADSWTPLLAAVETGSQDLVSTLLKFGARLSADRHLGFTPLHMACVMGHWRLVALLSEAMREQHQRVAAWGPSPQYVSMNVTDAYGRTALDVALLRYFNSFASDSQKAVDILRDFLSDPAQREDPGVVCGWEIFRVLRWLDPTLPPTKSVDAKVVEDEAPRSSKAARCEEQDDLDELLQAVGVLVRAGAQTRWILPDILQKDSSPAASEKAWSQDFGQCCGGTSRCLEGKTESWRSSGSGLTPSKRLQPKYSPLDLEDFADFSCAGLDDMETEGPRPLPLPPTTTAASQVAGRPRS
eukprot:TRINITY_DN112363_c0_g1_i1.p1 TRINITY_DN112363_c0_g1~~TRINITY_DN112363_c0_g1_i1.p1  ORF type:complete len:967 (+),score=217.98 TRINITY_DN112363_c0_g1_i1:143-3043(+)